MQVIAKPPVALVTGSARRIGACIAKRLHEQGYNVVIHYRSAAKAAQKLVACLNEMRANSASSFAADITQTSHCELLIQHSANCWGNLNVLINSASSFYPTPIGEVTELQWEDLMGSNLKAPFFLAQAARNALSESRGCIVNITDIHALRPLRNYPVYCVAKSGLQMLTKVLAKELAPHIRVNAIAPGPVLWPEGPNELSDDKKNQILSETLLKQHGSPDDIASGVEFFVRQKNITGQILAIDGGRSINF